jgi:hypothetical protein
VVDQWGRQPQPEVIVSEESKYKTRRAVRLAGHGPKLREKMPWWYEGAMADFAQREREQAESAKKGPLSSDPMQPWGNPRPRRVRDENAPRVDRFGSY